VIGWPRADASRTEPGVLHREPGALRICFVSADYPSDSTSQGGVGGIATHTATLARAIAGLGHEVTVLTASSETARRYSDGDVNVVAVPGGGRRLWKLGRWLPVTWMRRSWAVRRALAALRRERGFDVVSFPDGYGEGWGYSYSPMTPFTVHLYGPASVVQRWDGRAVPPIRARMEEWMERRPVRRAALVVCASRRFADEIARAWAVSPSRVRIIRNPVDLSMFRPRQSGGPPSRRIVLFVGHLQRLKGVETLAAAIPAVIRRQPETEFWFVGDDHRSGAQRTSMKAWLRRSFVEQGVAECVRFFDPVPQRELATFYQRCALLVLPSLNDVYPNVVLEAMACGRPCVVTSSVGAAELVVDGESGFTVPPGNPEALAERLSVALGMSQAAREAIGARGRGIVERRCASAVVAAESVEAFREAVSSCGGATETRRAVGVNRPHSNGHAAR
jgi:glycogen synthase